MSTTKIITEDKKSSIHKTRDESGEKQRAGNKDLPVLVNLQQQIGNRAVQRLLAQRAGDGPFEVDDDTASQINHARGGGQELDSAVQAQMGSSTGHDFSNVRVHTDPESHVLNEQLGAKAFTTGSDIFFRSGAYDPGSSGGQELLAHELTHVVQQDSGMVDNSEGRMTVNAPGDVYEQQADSVAKSFSNSTTAANVQKWDGRASLQTQEEDEIEMQEEDELEMQEEDEKEEDAQA